jgi:hydroxymethylbilane synthase
MLKRYFPEAISVTIRGNLQTRFRKMEEGQCDAMLLAWAGVHRMGFSHLVTEKLSTSVFTPAAGQGSLAIEVSKSLSSEIREGIRAAINHPASELALLAERAFLRKMEGGCSVPVFVLAELKGSILKIMGGVVSLDGVDEIRLEDSVEILPEAQRELAINLGERLGTSVLATGGSSILQKIKSNCD